MKRIALLTICAVLLASPVCAAKYFLCTAPNPTHDIFEISGLHLGGLPVQAKATDGRLQYDLSSLGAYTYCVKIRAYSYALGQWSDWGQQFTFIKAYDGTCIDITDGVTVPTGITIEVCDK